MPIDENAFEFGNCYFVADADSLVATHVSFQFIPHSSLINQQVFVKFFAWKKGNNVGDVNGDFKANEDEITRLGISDFIITGAEDGLVTVPIDIDVPYIKLEDNTFYFAVVNLALPDPNKLFAVSATEKLNYNPSFFLANDLGKGELKSFPMLRLGLTGDFDAFGFGLDRIPVVRLHVEKRDDLMSSSESFSEISNLNIFPNPASNQIQITIPKELYFEDLRIEISDNSGKIVSSPTN